MADFYKEKELPQLIEYGIEFFPLRHAGKENFTRAHIHPEIEFIYVTEGIYEIGIEDESFTAKSGDLLLLRSNVIHTLQHIGGDEGEYFALKIKPTILFRIFAEKADCGCVIPFIHRSGGDISFFSSDTLCAETKAILEEMIAEHHKSDKFSNVGVTALATMLLISLLRSVISPKNSFDDGEISEKNVSLIHESIKFINENYASDITPADCAALIDLSYSYFAKLFRAVVGKTFKEYLTGVRLAKARNILLTTTLPVTDVGAACGYGNLSYFISEYKKAYGKTPRDVRKELSGR